MQEATGVQTSTQTASTQRGADVCHAPSKRTESMNARQARERLKSTNPRHACMHVPAHTHTDKHYAPTHLFFSAENCEPRIGKSVSAGGKAAVRRGCRYIDA